MAKIDILWTDIRYTQSFNVLIDFPVKYEDFATNKEFDDIREYMVPVWYKRIVTKEWEKEIKILILDEEKAPILKEWLELFWNWVLLSKQNLYDYLEERWLKSNSKVNKTWKLHHSILDKILLPRKLYVYAGYITYPEMGVNEPVKAILPYIIMLAYYINNSIL